jgi:hypothetical protein
MAVLRCGGGLWPVHTAMRTPHSRTPQSARQENRECCGHNHKRKPRVVQAEIHDGSKQQRKHENPRYSCDVCHQVKSPVEARYRVSPFTLRSKRKSIAFRLAVTREFALQSSSAGRSPKQRTIQIRVAFKPTCHRQSARMVRVEAKPQSPPAALPALCHHCRSSTGRGLMLRTPF